VQSFSREPLAINNFGRHERVNAEISEHFRQMDLPLPKSLNQAHCINAASSSSCR
jgi:hypothetical protein